MSLYLSTSLYQEACSCGKLCSCYTTLKALGTLSMQVSKWMETQIRYVYIIKLLTLVAIYTLELRLFHGPLYIGPAKRGLFSQECSHSQAQRWDKEIHSNNCQKLNQPGPPVHRNNCNRILPIAICTWRELINQECCHRLTDT